MANDDRVTRLIEQITARIRPHCQRMSEVDLLSLAEQMAGIEDKYDNFNHSTAAGHP
jgi:hypothetical protein